MDRDQFDRLSRLIGSVGTRRDALRALLTGAVAGVAAGPIVGMNDAAAKRKRRKGRNRQARSQGKVERRSEPIIPLECPNTCNANCSTKPLIGGSNLTRCNFNDRDLDGVQLNGANLSRACFGNASLRFANFRGANLSGTCFCGADLAGADFRGTSASIGQLSCGQLACNTILPNGKPAVACAQGEACCNGECVQTGRDPNNCGACGVQCGPCQFCNSGTCENLPDAQFDCNGDPLGISQGRVCTTGPNTGICDGGLCNCGPGGKYDEDANVCLCNQTNTEFCQAEFGNCCEIESTCLVAGAIFESEFQCPACGPGGSPYTNLCCEYLCAASSPGPRPKKFVCIDNAEPGHTRCDSSFEGCSFNGADFVEACGACGA
jgi:hypothetical protein